MGSCGLGMEKSSEKTWTHFLHVEENSLHYLVILCTVCTDCPSCLNLSPSCLLPSCRYQVVLLCSLLLLLAAADATFNSYRRFGGHSGYRHGGYGYGSYGHGSYGRYGHQPLGLHEEIIDEHFDGDHGYDWWTKIVCQTKRCWVALYNTKAVAVLFKDCLEEFGVTLKSWVTGTSG